MCEFLHLDKQLRSIRGSLKVETAKKGELQQCIEQEKRKLEKIRDNPEYDDGIREDIRKRIKRYNDDLKALSYLLGRLRVKLAEVLSGITGAIISWILNEAAECWVSQNLWALVVGIGGLLYAYMVTKKKESYHDTS